MSGYIIALINSADFVECLERDGDFNMNSARSHATVFQTRSAAEAYAKTYVRNLTVIEPVDAASSSDSGANK